jgi:hypothetical protein
VGCGTAFRFREEQGTLFRISVPHSDTAGYLSGGAGNSVPYLCAPLRYCGISVWRSRELCSVSLCPTQILRDICLEEQGTLFHISVPHSDTAGYLSGGAGNSVPYLCAPLRYCGISAWRSRELCSVSLCPTQILRDICLEARRPEHEANRQSASGAEV